MSLFTWDFSFYPIRSVGKSSLDKPAFKLFVIVVEKWANLFSSSVLWKNILLLACKTSGQ